MHLVAVVVLHAEHEAKVASIGRWLSIHAQQVNQLVENATIEYFDVFYYQEYRLLL